ncbi:hypothetical protein HDU97_009326 [Phlyctochytrium planicorne]|nr:hypothetical protein HDU97_009326 [Phlyctochytrium planicorne]
MNSSLPIDLPASFTNLYYTYSHSSFSCIREFYYVHLLCSYAVFATGVLCMVTRLIPMFKWTHAWFGRAYIVSMLFAVASCLLIHNHGLAVGVLISFFWVLAGLAAGWIAIAFHQLNIRKMGVEGVEALVAKQGGILEPGQKFGDLLNQEMGRYAESKTISQRMFSYKALHGTCMFLSWFNIAGRVLVTKVDSADFLCRTYPVFKPGFEGREGLNVVPAMDPNYFNAPWAYREGVWAIATFFGPALASIVVGLITSFVAVQFSTRATDNRESAGKVKALSG